MTSALFESPQEISCGGVSIANSVNMSAGRGSRLWLYFFVKFFDTSMYNQNVAILIPLGTIDISALWAAPGLN